MPHDRGYVSDFMDRLQQKARYGFALAELQAAVPVGRVALNAALRRLALKGRLRRLRPQSDFIVIVPPEYRTVGAPPSDWFIDDYMRHIGLDYYVGLLTAAMWHGSSHFAVMTTQIVVPRQLRPVAIGRERIRFYTKATAARTPTERRVSGFGGARVSTREATLLDLVSHLRGGMLNQAATILVDLAPHCRAPAMSAALDAADDPPSAQRLGYLFERFGHQRQAATVRRWLERRPHSVCLLEPSQPAEGPRRMPWNLVENGRVEATR